MTIIAIKPDELQLWSRYIKEISGINLDASKGYLLETRLGGLLKEAGAGSFTDFYNKSKYDSTGSLRRKIVDAITTNETSFFRDTSPFDLLQNKIIPDLIDRKNKAGIRPVPIRIWSAASSTGQEAYSTGIVLKELLGDLKNYDIRILGTDISDRAIAAAGYGHFSKLELERGLSPDKLARYFTQSGDKWKIRDEIRAMATFRTMNLLEPFSFPVPFDIIFCRNVAIYFEEQDKQRLFKSLGKVLAKDGALIIGSTESLSGLCPEYEPKRYLRSVFYQMKGVA